MPASPPRHLRSAVYTRKSSEEGLEQAFNSLDAQREACEAYIKSQAGEGWHLIKTRYDDGGVSGGTMERPALRRLLADIEARKVDIVLVYKVDRLTRALADFAKIVEVFDAQGVSFVSVTQQFNTITSMGRLTLNMLLSFAQFEREVTGERIRDKIAASKKKGMWMGGFVPLGYDANDRSLVINEAEAETVRTVFRLYLQHDNVRRVKDEADRMGLVTKLRAKQDGTMGGGCRLSRGYIYKLLGNPVYVGRIAHKKTSYPGRHAPIIDVTTWDAVQAKLIGNMRKRRSGAKVAEPSLLAGLLLDDRGNRLSPSHAVKNGTRYRYYVSQAVLQHRHGEAGAVVRIPAQEIEDLVGARVSAFLEDPGQLIDELAESLSARDQQRLLAAAKRQSGHWPGMNPSARGAFIQSVVTSVTLSEEEIRLVLCRSGLRRTLLGDTFTKQMAATERNQTGKAETQHPVVIRVEARLRRCSGGMRLVIPPGHARDLTPRPNPALIKALSRAHLWKGRLISGQVPSIRAIAKEEDLAERYVGRILRLAFLAPDIVDAILDGYQPAQLELERLLQGVPLAWTEQRRAFGFPSGA